jgi:serine/threonine protein kinase
MQPERAERIANIVERALEVEVGARGPLLVDLCGNDEELFVEVASLLHFQEKARDFIEKPAVETAAELLADERTGLQAGDVLEGYKIISLLGEGGMGEVYLADDTKLKRKVAIKLLKLGLGTANIIRHFHQEERILAGLTHPNIAQLYGGDVTKNGLPYFVMEYVEGVRLDDYYLDKQLLVAERLGLFRKICAAVSYAHQHLVVHRDLKPANIRVTADGEPKLLDFGIAKLLEPGTTAIEQTMTFAAVMTPDYASPEQVRGETMTTASDVYSLGVVLYELLTEQKPYKIDNRTPTNIARAISEQEPTRPSTAIARSDGSSKSQITNPKLLRGDLDNIVMKALRKEPERRYQSVGQFSEDICRHLDSRPVIARKDIFTYRASKFVARNKVAVAAAALIVLAIIFSSIISLWQAKNARHQRDVAQRINSFLQRMLSFSNQSVTSVWPVAQKKDVSVNAMLDQITPQVEAELADQPDVRAQVLRTIGGAYASQGQYRAAEKNLRTALATQTALYGEENVESAATMLELGVLSYRQVKNDEAARLLEKAVAFYRKERRRHPSDYNSAQLTRALDYLGVVTFFQIDPYRAKPLLIEALQIASDANFHGTERGVLTAIKSDAGGVMVYTDERDKGEKLLREALAEYRALSPRPQWEQGATLTVLGIALSARQPDEAGKYMIEGERIYRETLGDSNFYLATNLGRQAALFLQKNDLASSEKKAREALAMTQNFSADNKSAWAAPMLTLGDILIKANRAREAEGYLSKALTILEEKPVKNYSAIASTKISLSQSLVAQNRFAEAERIALEARDEVARNLGGQHPALKATSTNLAKIYEKEGKHDLAEKLK